jgi:hypothetical protein
MRRIANLLLAALAALPAVAQDGKEKTPKWRLDPYTKNEPEAGYIGFGPFAFGNLADKPVTSKQIDDSLEFVQILWIETPHFRIGTNLPEWPVPEDPVTKKKIRTELEELQKKLPKVNPKTRTLDPWLRAHLTAQRMEKLYAETQKLFGVTDADFPADPAKVQRIPGARYMGYGPYLGMKDKFLVLAIEKAASFELYMKNFLGRPNRNAQRWHFKESGSILITLPLESNEFPLKHDTALHCGLAFNVSINLLDGFRHYGYELPVWIREGFGHWNCRRVDTKWPSFDQNEGAMADIKLVDKWDVLCRSLIQNNKVANFATVSSWRDFGDIKFNDHVACWSRVDWMMSQGPEKWQKFLFAIKGRVDDKWAPDQTDLVGALRDAMKEAYGVSALNVDAKWSEWVKATYPAQ